MKNREEEQVLLAPLSIVSRRRRRAGWICLMLSFRVAHGGYKIGFQPPLLCPPTRASSKLEVDPLHSKHHIFKLSNWTKNDLTNLPFKTSLPAICALIPWRGCWRFLSGIWRVSTLRRSSRRQRGERDSKSTYRECFCFTEGQDKIP